MSDAISNSRETEQRYRIDGTTARRLLEVLEATEPVVYSEQTDTYFDASWASFLMDRPIRQWVRLRAEGPRLTLTRKLFSFTYDVADFADEASIEVADAQFAHSMLRVLGYRELVVVRKRRTTFKFSQGFELALDDVDQLGFFVEIESADVARSSPEIRNDIDALARRLRIDISSPETSGYPYLLLSKLGHIQSI